MIGHIFIDGVITPDYHLELKRKLDANREAERIEVHMSSPGGSVYGGYNTYHTLVNFGKPIDTIIEGECQSIATFISLASRATSGKIKARNPSRYMIHNPSNGIKGSAKELEQGASELRRIEQEMAEAYSSCTGIPIEQIKQMMSDETVMTAQEAMQKKFIDEVLIDDLRAVALGKSNKKMEEKNFVQSVLDKIARALQTDPKAIDMKLKDGRMLSVPEATTEAEIKGKSAMVDGQPAAGQYELESGAKIVCMDGIVTEVIPAQAAPPAPSPEERIAALEQKITQLTQTATQAEAEKKAVEEAKKTAEQKLTVQTTALKEIEGQLQAMKKKTVGDDNAPELGIVPQLHPVAIGGKMRDMEPTMVFLNEYMPWLKQYYPESYFDKYSKKSFYGGPQAVSILETNFNYTWPGILTTEIFFKPTLNSPALSDIFTIDQGIKFSKKYNLLTELNKILKPYTGCTRVFNDNQKFITNTEVVVKEFQVAESWCKDDFTDYLEGKFNIFAQDWLKTGNRSFDPSGTPINTIIDELLTDALRRDVFRRASFAAGNSSDDDYNQFDGLWDRLIDSSGGSNYCVVRAGSALGTGTLAAGAALTALEAVYANSSLLLKEMFDAKQVTFWVTRSVWDNYYNSLIGTGAVTEQAFENLQSGKQTLTYKGIPVRPVSIWDSFLAESDNPLTATTRHLILLTNKVNHILGVEQGNDLNKIEGWYERKDRKFYWESDMKFGYNYLHCDLQTIAY